jgi:hypothetical protein
MKEVVVDGDELMPHRTQSSLSGEDNEERQNEDNEEHSEEHNEELEACAQRTPIRKLCRNRGLVLQEQMVVAETPEGDKTSKRKRLFRGEE